MKVSEFFKKLGYGFVYGYKKTTKFIDKLDPLGLVPNLLAEIISEFPETKIQDVLANRKYYKQGAQALKGFEEKYGEEFLDTLYEFFTTQSPSPTDKKPKKKQKKDVLQFFNTRMEPITPEIIDAFRKKNNFPFNGEEQERLLKALNAFHTIYCQVLINAMDRKDQVFVQVLTQRIVNELDALLNQSEAEDILNSYFTKEPITECPNCHVSVHPSAINPKTGLFNCVHCKQSFLGYKPNNDAFLELQKELKTEFEKHHQDFIQLENALKTAFKDGVENIKKDIETIQKNIDDLSDDLKTAVQEIVRDALSQNIKNELNDINQALTSLETMGGNVSVLKEMIELSRFSIEKIDITTTQITQDTKEIKDLGKQILNLLNTLQKDTANNQDTDKHTCPDCHCYVPFKWLERTKAWRCSRCGLKIKDKDIKINMAPSSPKLEMQCYQSELMQYLTLSSNGSLEENETVTRLTIKLTNKGGDLKVGMNAKIKELPNLSTIVLHSDSNCTLNANLLRELLLTFTSLKTLIFGNNVCPPESIPYGWEKNGNSFIKKEK